VSDTTSHRNSPLPPYRRPRPFATCTMFGGVALGVALLLAACVWTVAEPVLIREPRPEPVPLYIGVYFPPELRSFTFRHHITDTAYVLGEPSAQLLNEALALLFTEVVEVPRPGSGPGPRGDLAGIIEPRIISAGFKWSLEKSGPFPTQITYGFTLYSRRGETVASWDVTGQHNEPASGNPLAAVGFVRRNFELSMREAAWKFTSGFRNVPEVRQWLEKQGVR
jgi:hypothetical protein